MNPTTVNFLSMHCKRNDHIHCASRWHGLGIEAICTCKCHLSKKKEALRLVGRPVGNAVATIKGSITL